ncbi:MAG: hypothetical protein LUH07_04280 [Lachnospiraceae bacterium]|nr:hypothetical protein [Lachnospiraceae bacterium]
MLFVILAGIGLLFILSEKIEEFFSFLEHNRVLIMITAPLRFLADKIFTGLFRFNTKLFERGLEIRQLAIDYMMNLFGREIVMNIVSFFIMMLTGIVLLLIFSRLKKVTDKHLLDQWAPYYFWQPWAAFLIILEISWFFIYYEAPVASVFLQMIAMCLLIYMIIRAAYSLIHLGNPLCYLLGTLTMAIALLIFPFLWGLFSYMIFLAVCAGIAFLLLMGISLSSGTNTGHGNTTDGGGDIPSPGPVSYSTADLPNRFLFEGEMYHHQYGNDYVCDRTGNTITITTVYSMTDSDASTNAGHLYFW